MATTAKANSVIRAFLFDLDGTLFDRDAAVRSLSETQHVAFERELPRVSREAFVAKLMELDCHGAVDKETVYKRLVLEFELPEALAPRLVDDFWRRYHHSCRPFPDAVNTLQELRARGKKVGLITNGRKAIQNGTIDALRIRQLLDAILISEVEGLRKPDRAIFERAATRLGVAPVECCYVGDHPEVDVAGAIGAGMTAVWKRVPYWTQPSKTVPTIDTLGELLARSMSR